MTTDFGPPVADDNEKPRFLEEHERVSQAAWAEAGRRRLLREDRKDVVAVCVACFWEERQLDPEPYDWNKLDGWLRTVVEREVNELRRHDSVTEDLPYEEHVESPAGVMSDPHEILLGKEAEELIRRVIARLPKKQRECFRMAEQGLTPAEVAEVLGIGEKTVWAYGHRTRLAVQAALGPEYMDALRGRNPNRGRTNR